jgi:hypothetical protein
MPVPNQRSLRICQSWIPATSALTRILFRTDMRRIAGPTSASGRAGTPRIHAEGGEIVASDLIDKEVDDVSHVEALPEQLSFAPTSFMGVGTYDRACAHDTILDRNPLALFIVPPCKCAVPGLTAATSPTQRDRYVLAIDAHGRPNWQKASGHTWRSKVEAAIGRYKRVIGDTLKSRDDTRRVTEVKITVKSLNRMRELGHAKFVRVT